HFAVEHVERLVQLDEHLLRQRVGRFADAVERQRCEAVAITCDRPALHDRLALTLPRGASALGRPVGACIPPERRFAPLPPRGASALGRPLGAPGRPPHTAPPPPPPTEHAAT